MFLSPPTIARVITCMNAFWHSFCAQSSTYSTAVSTPLSELQHWHNNLCSPSAAALQSLSWYYQTTCCCFPNLSQCLLHPPQTKCKLTSREHNGGVAWYANMTRTNDSAGRHSSSFLLPLATRFNRTFSCLIEEEDDDDRICCGRWCCCCCGWWWHDVEPGRGKIASSPKMSLQPDTKIV